MDKRIALIAIIVKSTKSADSINSVLHEYGEYIIGRMGLPYREKGVNIISVAVDAPQSIISALSGQIGKIAEVSVKTIYAPNEEEG